MQGLTNVSKQQRGELPNRREGTEKRTGTLVKRLILCRDEMRDGSENIAAEGVSVDTASAKTKAAPEWGAASQVFLFRFDPAPVMHDVSSAFQNPPIPPPPPPLRPLVPRMLRKRP